MSQLSTELLIAIPVLDRPQRAQPVFESASSGTDVPHRVLFVLSPGDRAQRSACLATGADLLEVPWQAGPGDYAKKINAAYRMSDEPWIFLGADDLHFADGWASAALEHDAGVIGTSDGRGNPRVRAGRHATHSLVSRAYADELGTIDGPGAILCEKYDHQFVDDELVETAKARDQWAFAAAAVVEHLHPYFGKAAMDATYEKALRATRADQRLFNARRQLIGT